MPIDDKPFRRATKALASARLSVTRMAAAHRLDTAEHEWRSFLNFIAQVPEKLRKGYRGVGGAVEPWVGQQVAASEADQLLEYVAQARHADMHTGEEAVNSIPGKYDARIGRPGEFVYVDHLAMSDAGILSYRGTAPIEESVTPARMELAPIVNRGRTYAPPTMHLGQAFDSHDPGHVAAAAVQHYERMLREFEERFLSGAEKRGA